MELCGKFCAFLVNEMKVKDCRTSMRSLEREGKTDFFAFPLDIFLENYSGHLVNTRNSNYEVTLRKESKVRNAGGKFEELWVPDNHGMAMLTLNCPPSDSHLYEEGETVCLLK